MKLSETLYNDVEECWNEAVHKAFLIEMAEGSLKKERFCYYMLQDYLYLKDYIDLLKNIIEKTTEPLLQDFLKNAIKETEQELMRVHIPAMKKLGINETQMNVCKENDVIRDYLEYMNEQVEQGGVIPGLVALLQCSWAYAYITEKLL